MRLIIISYDLMTCVGHRRSLWRVCVLFAVVLVILCWSPNVFMTCLCFVCSGLGYIVGSKVAEALDGWQWSLRVSLRQSRYFCYERQKLLWTQAALYSTSCLKTAGELKIALAGTSRRSMRERCTSIIDSNTDKPGLSAYPPAIKWLLSPMLLSPAKWN